MDDDNVQQMVELVEGEDGEQMVQYVNVDNMTEEEVMAYLKSQAPPPNAKGEGNAFVAKGKGGRTDDAQFHSLRTVVSPSNANNMPEDFMQEE
ncbi:hypothetical protein OESDEN_18754 [Oesophagostomum dentatum]|uniref:Uncharacterized protein n=1 Tax=Oesophagostomum dentatum TaxID=61180 RepID=A0A0B1S9F8_OESDE|nr:hypothetical protein OESDEN_18754 [Oesophagostomum dentatum]